MLKLCIALIITHEIRIYVCNMYTYNARASIPNPTPPPTTCVSAFYAAYDQVRKCPSYPLRPSLLLISPIMFHLPFLSNIPYTTNFHPFSYPFPIFCLFLSLHSYLPMLMPFLVLYTPISHILPLIVLHTPISHILMPFLNRTFELAHTLLTFFFLFFEGG